MTQREMVVATIEALKGEHIYDIYWTYREAKFAFREYARWLADKPVQVSLRGSVPEVLFCGGGCVRFVSSAHQLDGVKPFWVTMDDILRMESHGE